MLRVDRPDPGLLDSYMYGSSPISNHGKPPGVDFVGVLAHRVETSGLSVAEIRDDAAVHVQRHTHAAPHFCAILSPGYRTSARGVDDLCGRGTLLFHPGGTTHEDRFLRRGGRFLVLKPTARGPLVSGAATSLPARSEAFNGPLAESLCEKIFLELRRTDLSSSLALECLYLELVGLAGRVTPLRRRPSWIDRVLENVQDSRATNPSVGELASLAGVHPVSLARAFRRHVGMSPGEVLRWSKLQRVLPKLSATDRDLADLALEAGFSDQSSFTRACRRTLGITPGRYRAYTRPRSRR